MKEFAELTDVEINILLKRDLSDKKTICYFKTFMRKYLLTLQEYSFMTI